MVTQDTMEFYKMHGLGNDFVMINGKDLDDSVNLSTLTKTLCDRHFGIGADGLIVAQKPSDPEKYDAKFVYFNGDGSRAEMCGNGIRCFALFVLQQGLVTQSPIRTETDNGLLTLEVHDDETVTVDMGNPVFDAKNIPFNGNQSDKIITNHPLSVNEQTIPISTASMGNPHCIIFQNDLPEVLDPAVWGPIIETHTAFPNKTNVEFVTIKDENTVDVVVWERGCGFTLACGTGACAVGVLAHSLGKTKDTVTVNLPGGPLKIFWDKGKTGHVFMTGPATTVFSGKIDCPL